METFFMYFRRLFHYLFITAFSFSGVANAMQSLRFSARTTSVTHRSMAASVAIRNMKSSASKSNTHLKIQFFLDRMIANQKKIIIILIIHFHPLVKIPPKYQLKILVYRGGLKRRHY